MGAAELIMSKKKGRTYEDALIKAVAFTDPHDLEDEDREFFKDIITRGQTANLV